MPEDKMQCKDEIKVEMKPATPLCPICKTVELIKIANDYLHSCPECGNCFQLGEGQ